MVDVWKRNMYDIMTYSEDLLRSVKTADLGVFNYAAIRRRRHALADDGGL